MTELHKKKLMNFCRVCGDYSGTSRLLLKSSTEELVKEYYHDDFSEDNEYDHPGRVCRACYSKLKRWKNEKIKFDKNKKRNEEKNIEFEKRANLPADLSLGILSCSQDGSCKVCNLKLDEPKDDTEPSPAKYQKLFEHPQVSPSDARKKTSNPSKPNTAGRARKSIFVEKSESENQVEKKKRSKFM